MAAGSFELRKSGLLNIDAPDLRDMRGEPKIIRKAYCSSLACTRDVTAMKRKQKDVPLRLKHCPDCGHILIWNETRRITQ